ncbi:MAG: hypothetical protein V3U75_04270 [Methylococcaceae bacterium]
MKDESRGIITILILTVLVVVVAFAFFHPLIFPEEKVWGQGDPTAEHQEFFGNGNLSRLCFVQTQTINRQGQALTALALRVIKLEDPNGP